ncbi:MAG: DedA family protein [Desulfuromonadales bacterium]|nr:DedA family protein [Desulfuromonadales bacterium]
MQEFLGTHLIEHGYLVLFIWALIEGESGLILAGFLAFQGYLTVPGVIFTAAGGAFVGDQFYFYLGRLKGKYLLRHSHTLVRKLRKGLRLIKKYGNFVAFTSRYTYGFRIVLPIILGITPFPGLRFLVLNIFSAISWAIIFTFAGYLFGESASLVVGEGMKSYERYIIAILAGIMFLAWFGQFAYSRWKQMPARKRLKRMKLKGMFSKSDKKQPFI